MVVAGLVCTRRTFGSALALCLLHGRTDGQPARDSLGRFPLPAVDGMSGPDSMTVHATVTSEDYQTDEGVFDLPEPEVSLTVKPDTELYRWLSAHRGRPVVITFRELRGVK